MLTAWIRLQPGNSPSVNLPPSGYLLLFASDKDIKDAQGYELSIDLGEIWKYHIPTSPIPANWRVLSFDDSGWESGETGIGYSDGDDATQVPSGTTSIFLRKIFQAFDIGSVTELLLHVDYDDGFVAYLNGIEIARANIGIPGILPEYDELASGNREARIYSGGLPETFVHPDPSSILQEGDNVLAIEVHNVASTSSDMSLFAISDFGSKWVCLRPPAGNPALIGFPHFIQISELVARERHFISFDRMGR